VKQNGDLISPCFCSKESTLKGSLPNVVMQIDMKFMSISEVDVSVSNNFTDLEKI
jgi:hypothetical protein